MDELDDKDLPWQEMQTLFIGENYGIINIPQIGSDVWVFFEQGNIYSPIYIQQVTKNYKNNYLPKEYKNIDNKDIDKIFVQQYPNRFSKDNNWQYIIYDTSDTQKFEIISPYKNNRFNFLVENNKDHKNHIIIQYTGNDIKIEEISNDNDSKFTYSQGIDFNFVHNIIIEDNTKYINFQIIQNNVNKIEMYYDKIKSLSSLKITNDKNYIQMNKDNINMQYNDNVGQIKITKNEVTIGTNTISIKPSINTDLTLQYKEQLQEVKEQLNKLVQQFNNHTHTGVGNMGQPLVINPPLSPIVLTYTKSEGTITTKQW